MPHLKWYQPALEGVSRLYNFLRPKSRGSTQRAVKTIRKGVKALQQHPRIGRPIADMDPEFREWPIAFGAGSYVVLYRYDGKDVLNLAVRHSLENGYRGDGIS